MITVALCCPAGRMTMGSLYFMVLPPLPPLMARVGAARRRSCALRASAAAGVAGAAAAASAEEDTRHSPRLQRRVRGGRARALCSAQRIAAI